VPPTTELPVGYVPPIESPPLIDVLGGDSKVATDRLYSIEHVWVKTISGNLAVIGISDKLQMLISNIDHIVIPMVGDKVTRNQSFTYIEGGKMSVELPSPVSGEITDRNAIVLATNRAFLGPINTDPYVQGWMLVINLSNPEELKSLLTAEEYALLQSKATTTTPAPA
jgi:glycine cleavage system H protein